MLAVKCMLGRFGVGAVRFSSMDMFLKVGLNEQSVCPIYFLEPELQAHS
jgi:hypothetical protein